MKLGGVIFGVAVAFLVIVGVGMAIAILSSNTISDTYGNAPNEQVNTSVGLVTNTTAIGQSAGTGLFMIFALLLVFAAISFLMVYGKYK